MDRTRVSGALDLGSIPSEATAPVSAMLAGVFLSLYGTHIFSTKPDKLSHNREMAG